MDKTRILITGGAGFIGSSLADDLSNNSNYEIVCVDNLTTGKKSNIPGSDNVKIIKCDVNRFEDISPLMSSHKFDYVFHYAAVVGVQRTLNNPVSVLRDIEGIRNILELSKNIGVKRVFYASSSEVYGEPVEFPQIEDTTPLNSRLPYAVVKNVGESFCRSFNSEYGLKYTILRFFNTYGPKQSADFVITRFLQAAFKNELISIYGDGLQTRTFCFIKDNVEVTRLLMGNGLCINETINIGSDIETSILELANQIVQLTGSKSTIEFLPPLDEGDMSRRQPDNNKMKQIIGRPLIAIEDGLKEIITPKFERV